jgi:hypothetical protein
MPKSKHRRKPGAKAVAHPGRGKPGKPLQAWLDELAPDHATPNTSGLPLFDWAEREPAAVRRRRKTSAASAEPDNPAGSP